MRPRSYRFHICCTLILSLLVSLLANLSELPENRLIAIKTQAQTSLIPVLFDNTKAETAGNADWIIDTDQPTPSPNNPTSESSWLGAISAWGVALVKSGKYRVSTLPSTGRITYGDSSNPQDLSKYKIFILPEPNIAFSSAEKSAIINFVENGGGLFMVADHINSDRNNDGIDSPRIFNSLMNSNPRGINNIFGIQYDLNTISNEDPSNLTSDAGDPIIHGPYGSVAGTILRAGATMTISTASNPNVRGVIFRNSFSNTGNTGVVFTRSQFGAGRIAASGDSSPIDDGTGQPNNNLFNGWKDPAATNEQLYLNATEWLAGGSLQPGFSLGVSPSSQTITAGSSTSYTVAITPQNGFTGSVTLSVNGLPIGATGNFTANPINAGQSTTLTISTTTSAATGTFMFTISGTGNGSTKSTTASLTINTATMANFSIALSPTSKSLTQGTATTLTVSTTSIAGFSSPITLSATGLPAGITANFSANPVNPGASSTMTLTASGTATKGSANVTVSGVANSLTRTATLSLTVTAGSTELIVNGDFENSSSPWVLGGATYYNTSGGYPHSGAKYIHLGNSNNATGTAYQQITIASTATSANLTFWLNVTTNETTTSTQYDNMYVEVRSTSGALLRTLATYSNLNRATIGVYSQKGSFSLLDFKGQTIRIQFRGVNDFSYPTTFRIDDVSVK
ncbi:MAG: hypothetical protein AB1489_40390 [Acidobacteriota bacterium]